MQVERNLDQQGYLWNIDLRVNGTTHRITIEPSRTLLEVLRETLDLIGSKRGCDRGECGSCTVLLDGKPVYPCQILAVQARNQEVMTVEGLAGEAHLHPLQRAFINGDGGQCGYCSPGFLMAARALLDSNPAPTRDEVKQALAGNICRCNAYGRIIESVLDAAGLMAGEV